jgi:uncharacterized membrane protein
MKNPQAAVVSGSGDSGQWNRGKKRTLADTVLISIWVIGYAIILVMFRLAKVVESHYSGHDLQSSGARPERRM